MIIKDWSLRLCRWGILLLLPAFGVAAADRATLNAQLDIDGNKKLDYGEVLLGLRHRNTPGKVNLPQIQKDKKLPEDIYLDKDLQAQYPIFIAPRPNQRRHSPPYSLDEIDPAEFGLEKVYSAGPTEAEKASRRYVSKFELKLRRSKDDLANNQGDAYEQGALFSFGHDYDTKADQWTAKGIVALSYELKENPNYDPYALQREAETVNSSAGGKSSLPPAAPPAPAVLQTVSSLFTLEFEKVDTSPGDKDEVNSLTFGEHLVLGLYTGGHSSLVNSVMVDFAGKWATDFAFNKKIYDLEVEVAPLFNLSGGGDSYGHPIRWSHSGGEETLLAWKWGIVFHAEAGKVEENNGEAALMQNDRFARIGARANIELRLLPDLLKNRLSLTASYLDYEALTTDTHRSRLFRASAQYILVFATGKKTETESGAMINQDARAALRVEYQDGEIPLVQEKDKSVLVGFGVFF
ncbi:MAG TPA: hypothetical protein VGW57_00100 [Chthoniobacterales bacterium]|nr:hypothetical protein [Chthoniobacterales bacterium]